MRLRIATHSGESFRVQDDNYNAAELNMQLNNDSIHTIELGGVIISRIDVKLIAPLEPDEKVPEEIIEEGNEKDVPVDEKDNAEEKSE